MTRFRSLLVAFAMFWPPSVSTADLVAADPWQIIHIAREFGSAEVARDSIKDAMIQGRMGEVDYSVTFYDCFLGRDCKAILFKTRFSRAAWTEKRLPHSIFREWNRTKLFGRAFRDRDGSAVLEHAVDLSGGMPSDTLRATFARWRAVSEEFSDFLDD